MSINERVKEIRNKNHLSQKEFGRRICISDAAVSQIETGKSGISNQTILSICREFNVNEEWLRDGVGQMERKAFDLRDLLERNHATQLEIDLVQAYFELDTATRETVMDALKQMFASMRGEDTPERFPMTREQCHAELDRQLDDEEKAGEKSSASGQGASGSAGA